MSIRRTMVASVALLLGCAGPTADGTGDFGGPARSDAGSTGTSADGGSQGGGGDPHPFPTTPDGGGSTGGGGADGGSSGGSLDAGSVPPPSPGGGPVLPTPVGTCPEFKNGTATFTPKSGGTRTVTITMTDAAKTKSGPLILYWYATGSSPAEASYGLPMSAVTAAGGIVVAPSDVSGAGSFPWLSQLSQHYDLADEIVACAAQKTGFDHRHIHTVGMSAGGLMSTQLSFARSSYLASVAAYSGGTNAGVNPPFQESSNKFAVMAMTGGTNDNVFGQDFFAGSKAWQAQLKGAGHFAMLCDHGGGHTIPTKLVPGVFQFFMDHPYGVVPSPYAGGKIPAAINPPCVE